MADEYYWRTSDPMVFEIAGQKFDLDTKGAAYAQQFGALVGWLGTHGLAGLMAGVEDGVFDVEGSETELVTTLISYLMQYGISPAAMIDLGAIVLNTDKEFVEENFDPGWFVDGLITLFDNKPGIRGAVTRLWQRFFLATPTDDEEPDDTGDTEDQPQD